MLYTRPCAIQAHVNDFAVAEEACVRFLFAGFIHRLCGAVVVAGRRALLDRVAKGVVCAAGGWDGWDGSDGNGLHER